MLTSEIALGIALFLDIVLGIGVFANYPKRCTNQFFFLLTIATAIWLMATWSILHATSPQTAILSIREATMAAALIPLFCNLIRLAITHHEENAWQIVKRGKFYALAATTMALVVLSDEFLIDVVIPRPEANSFEVVEPIYGPAYPLLIVYLLAMMGILALTYMRDRKITWGRQRAELDFVVLGAAFALLAGTILSPITAVYTNSSRYIPVFNALSIMLLNSIVAYGIATRQIMGIAAFLRRMLSYLLLTAYLSVIYILVWHTVRLIMVNLSVDADLIAHLLPALAVAFAIFPAYGWIKSSNGKFNFMVKGEDSSETVRKASAIFQSITTVQELLDQFVEYLATTMGTDSVSVLLDRGDHFALDAHCGDKFCTKIQMDSSVIRHLKTHKREQVIVAENIRRYAKTQDLLGTLKSIADLRAAAVAGLYSKQELIGIILLGDRLSGEIYYKSQQDTLEIFSNQMAIALDNAKLYSEIQNQNIYTESLLENLVNGVVAVDSAKTITVCNSEAERILGLQARILKQAGIAALPREMADAIEQIFSTGRPIRNREAVIQNEREETASILMGGSLIRGHEGDVIGTLLVFNDQSAVKQLESQVRRSERLASAGQLAAGMAHEIKNPLVTIKTFAELLPLQYDDEEFRNEFSPLVGEEINRIDNIVNQLLHFARPAKPNFSPAHIHDTITHALQLLDRELKKNSISVDSELNSDNDLVRADANQLHQVFVNLILNAITAMKKRNGVLTIASDRIEWLAEEDELADMENKGPYIRIDFKDTGCGIAEEDVRRIFDPFYTTSAGGSGMGLSVAHTIITDHGGRINVSSLAGTGSTFSVLLPLLHRESDV